MNELGIEYGLIVHGDITASIVSASYIGNLYGTASYTTTSSYALTIPQNVFVTDITASSVSASYIITKDPTLSEQVATKRYVDQVGTFGLSYYFRYTTSSISNYNNMFKLDTPLSASNQTLTINAASASQYLFSWVSPDIGVTNLKDGNITFHYHLYRIGGNAANSVQTELYLRTGTTEKEISTGTPNTITTDTNSSYIDILALTSSIITNTTDKIVAKLKCINGAGTPNISTLVEGVTAAGITIQIPSSQFVLKSGDTMTGPLIGTLTGTASYSNHSLTASWSPSPGKVVVLCTAYTPTSTGADPAEIPIPYSPYDGITPISWSVKRINLRTQTQENATSELTIQKSIGSGLFSPIYIGSILLNSGQYETSTGSLETINSGDKIRFNVNQLGSSTNWTVTAEINNI